MTCPMYRDYEVGAFDQQAFTDHVQQCTVCKHFIQKDKMLMAQVEILKRQPIPSPVLWPRIEEALRQEHRKSSRSAFSHGLRGWLFLSVLSVWGPLPSGKWISIHQSPMVFQRREPSSEPSRLNPIRPCT